MIITEYRVDGAADIHSADSHTAADNCTSIAIVADLHEFEPKPVLLQIPPHESQLHGKIEPP